VLDFTFADSCRTFPFVCVVRLRLRLFVHVDLHFIRCRLLRCCSGTLLLLFVVLFVTYVHCSHYIRCCCGSVHALRCCLLLFTLLRLPARCYTLRCYGNTLYRCWVLELHTHTRCCSLIAICCCRYRLLRFCCCCCCLYFTIVTFCLLIC